MPDEAKLKLLRRSKRCQVVKHGKFYLIGRFLNYLIQPIWYIHIVWKLEKNVQIFVANNFGESGENVKSKFLCNFFRQMWSLFDEDKSQKIQRFPVESDTEKFVYIRLEKIQNFSSNWKVKNLFTFSADNFDFFCQIE